MNRIISDTFEQLEQLVKTTAKQTVQQPKKMVEEATSIVTGKVKDEGIEGRPVKAGKPTQAGQKSGQPKLTQSQIAQKIEEASQMRSKLHLQEIERQISEIQEQRLKQIKQVQEEVFKEEEEQKGPQEAQLPSKRKKGISPIGVVKRLKQKVEGFRGVSG